MAWELKKVEEQRKQLVELYFQGDVTMADICRHFGISRKTGYKWLQRYDSLGDKGLVDLPKAPHKPNRQYSDWHIDKAIKLKAKHLMWGPRKILAVLKREYPDTSWPSRSRLHEIFKDQGLVRKRRYRRRVPATHPLGYVKGANDVWSADFKGWWMTGDGAKCEPFTLTDGHSRFVIRCVHIYKKTAENVWGILDGAFREFGLPQRFRTDNGPPFGSVAAGRLTPLSVNLIKAGVIPEWIEPGHPQENGRHERFHLTLKESVALPPAHNLKTQLRLMQEFVQEYNYYRPHESLSMKTPGDCYIASARTWDGTLRSPEYESKNGPIRKVTPGGTFWFAGEEGYTGKALTGEYVQLREEGRGSLSVYYGPVYLGEFVKGNGLVKPTN